MCPLSTFQHTGLILRCAWSVDRREALLQAAAADYARDGPPAQAAYVRELRAPLAPSGAGNLPCPRVWVRTATRIPVALTLRRPQRACDGCRFALAGTRKACGAVRTADHPPAKHTDSACCDRCRSRRRPRLSISRNTCARPGRWQRHALSARRRRPAIIRCVRLFCRRGSEVGPTPSRSTRTTCN